MNGEENKAVELQEGIIKTRRKVSDVTHLTEEGGYEEDGTRGDAKHETRSTRSIGRYGVSGRRYLFADDSPRPSDHSMPPGS